MFTMHLVCPHREMRRARWRAELPPSVRDASLRHLGIAFIILLLALPASAAPVFTPLPLGTSNSNSTVLLSDVLDVVYQAPAGPPVIIPATAALTIQPALGATQPLIDAQFQMATVRLARGEFAPITRLADIRRHPARYLSTLQQMTRVRCLRSQAPRSP